MHSQIFDFLSEQENFDIRFPAGEALRLLLENAPNDGETVLTIGVEALSPPLIEVAGVTQIDLDAHALGVIPEGRLCTFNLWHRNGSQLDLVAEGRFVRRASIAPAIETAPFRASPAGPLLLFDGDSVMQNMPGTRVFLEQMLGHKFRFPVGYQNATGGDSAQKVFFGAPEVVAQIDRGNTVVLVGPIGANQTAEDDSFGEITGYMEQVFNLYLAAGAIVVAVPTLPDGMGVTSQDDKKQALADWVAAFANGGTVSHGGVDHVVVRRPGFFAVDTAEFDRDTMKSDVSHPNVRGAKFLAKALADILAPLVADDIYASAEIQNILAAGESFQSPIPSENPGIVGFVPSAWAVNRMEGTSLWHASFDENGVFEISVTSAVDEGTCVLTFAKSDFTAVSGDIVSFAADVEILPGAVGLKSIGLGAEGQSPMTLDPDWAVSPGMYHLRTEDMPYEASKTGETFQVFFRVASGASVTVKFHRATAYFVENISDPVMISGTPVESAMVGVAYSFTPVSTGGLQPLAFELAGGALPSGLELNASNGAITGTPNEVGKENGIAVLVRDARGDEAVLPYFSIDVIEASVPVNIAAPQINLPAPKVGEQLAATTGTWSHIPHSYHYQWHADGLVISGAVDTVLTLTEQEVGKAISVSVVAQNAIGESVAAFSGATSAVQPSVSNLATWDSSINTSEPFQLSYTANDTQVGTTEFTNGMRHARGKDVLAGKCYFEVILGPQILGVGVATGAVTALSGGSFGVERSFWSGSFQFYSGGNTNMGEVISYGDVVQIALDVDAQLIWMRKNGAGDWNNDANANPETDTGGFDISSLGAPIYAYAAFQNDPSAHARLAGRLEDLLYSAPVGFTPII